MSAESSVPSTLSPRAAVAMLSLQLRAAIQEADTAEADANSVDEDAARAQLRARLEPLMIERSRALDASLASARADAAEAITAARAEARRMIEQAAANAEARRIALAAARVAPMVIEARVVEPEVVEPEVVEPEVVEPEVVHVDEVEPQVVHVDVVEPDDVEPDVVEPDVVEPQVIEAHVVEPEVVQPDLNIFQRQTAAPHSVVSSNAPVHITVGLDAEAFAAAFATVFANLIEERLGGAQGAFAPRSNMGPYIVTHLAEPKQSFWKNARHLDVALLGLASAIALLVLAAWLV